MQLQKAKRKKVKLRLNLSSPSGAGKTMSALLMAYGLVEDWNKITVIDTENGSASLYDHLGPFNAFALEPPFTPERYIQAIDIALKGDNTQNIPPAECIIIDSSSHEWDGSGGCIEINEKIAQAKYKGNSWSAWNETTPRHEAFVNKILQCNAHIITCTRSKMETVMGEGKKVIKVGMKDIQRSGWEYELTVSLNIERDTHMAIVSKDRTQLFENKEPFIITTETGKMIKEWCESGIDEIKDAISKLKNCNTIDELTLLKEILPSTVINHPDFRNAGKKRYDELESKKKVLTKYDNKGEFTPEWKELMEKMHSLEYKELENFSINELKDNYTIDKETMESINQRLWELKQLFHYSEVEEEIYSDLYKKNTE